MEAGLHRGQPLTPKSFARLWADLFCGLGLHHVRVIEGAVVAEHLASGGGSPTMEIGAIRKKALTHLHNYRGTKGYWAVGPFVETAGRGASMNRFTLASLDDLQAICATHKRGRYEATLDAESHRVYGTGAGAVYLYYWPSERHVWETGKGMNAWPCKIGKSSTDVTSRVIDQFGTSRNELPVIAWEYRSDEFSELESELLSLLPLVPEQVKGGTGREWRLASPGLALMLLRGLTTTATDNDDR